MLYSWFPFDIRSRSVRGGLVVINRASHNCVTKVQLWPRVVWGLSFSRSQPDSEGFSPGTRLPVSYIWLGLPCSEITHGSYGGSRGRLHMHSVRSRWTGWSWKALVGSGSTKRTFTFTFKLKILSFYLHQLKDILNIYLLTYFQLGSMLCFESRAVSI